MRRALFWSTQLLSRSRRVQNSQVVHRVADTTTGRSIGALVVSRRDFTMATQQERKKHEVDSDGEGTDWTNAEDWKRATTSDGQVGEFVIAALYKFALLENYEEMREPLIEFCREQGIKGTLLLAREGINGTVSGSRQAIDNLLSRLRSDARLEDLDHKESFHQSQPFLRMKVRLKKEIVTLGVPEVDPTSTVGTYVPPKDWNKLISDPEVLLLDTRNKYEYKIGTFQNAVDPETETFREFPEFCDKILAGASKDKKIAMFCTGGIRCEKSTSFLKQRGFNNVYHLKGGILKYLEEIPEEESMWKGDCYVFDHRVAVTHGLKQGTHTFSCGGCRHPLSAEDLKSEDYVEGIQCAYCKGNVTEEHLARVTARQKQIELARERQEEHLGAQPVYKKRKNKKQQEEKNVQASGQEHKQQQEVMAN